jgi:hypothetical protein
MKTKVVKDEVKDEKNVDCDLIKQDFVNCKSMRMSRRTFVRMTGAAVGAMALGRFGFRMAAAA